jgi:5-methylcytosine-specific restriction endonuclease McrA
MLREDKTASFEKGLVRYRFRTGKLLGPWLGRRAYVDVQEAQRTHPVPVLDHERRRWWLFQGRAYWEDDGLDPTSVTALVLERNRRKERQLQRAKDLMLAGEHAGRGREPLPDEVKRSVFRRDGGRCVTCGSNELLQFDHVIPVSLGGASTVENLQLLCAPCNREKGDAL